MKAFSSRVTSGGSSGRGGWRSNFGASYNAVQKLLDHYDLTTDDLARWAKAVGVPHRLT